MKEQIRGVPASRVGEVTQSFLRDGFSKITCTAGVDGTWTITATKDQ
jgi:hypothetical protein